MTPIPRNHTKTWAQDFGGQPHPEDGGASGGDSESPLAIVGIVVACLTLFVGIWSLRNQRFRRWTSRLLTWGPIRKAPGTTSPDPAPTPATIKEDSSAIKIAETPKPASVLIFTVIADAYPASTHSGVPPYSPTDIIGEDSGAPQAEEFLEPKKPEPAATGSFPRGQSVPLVVIPGECGSLLPRVIFIHL
ncbi:unnamed protein product [Tuber aestivum]|uniref:Uncharacterized protein n=1 Tax=Tuber aestivum TaxID=59557 RepID=A0A292PXD1_9PEZI|nr:unnamed protein product [Tuber aestivum]